MAEWADNANSLNGAESTSISMKRICLESIIHDRTSNIHRIDEDIEELEQAIQNIDRAIEGFKEAASDMQLLESEVALVFKGESATAFLNKISAYKNFCTRRIEHMETLKSNYNCQIARLKHQKVMAQNLINSLREQLEKLRNICIR